MTKRQTGQRYETQTLDNGFIVIHQKTDANVFSAALTIRHGAYDETHEERGFAHLLEHVLAESPPKGMGQRKSTNMRTRFGHFNLFTSPLKTIVLINSLEDDLDAALAFMANSIIEPSLPANILEQQRAIVLREIADDKSTPLHEAHLSYSKAMYGKSPRATYVLGDEEIVRDASRDALAAFHGRGYFPNNAHITIAGGIPDDITRSIDMIFGKWKQGNVTPRNIPAVPLLDHPTELYHPVPWRVNTKNPETSSASLTIGWHATPTSPENDIATAMLNYILGAGRNSRLFRTLRNKKRLAYDVSSAFVGGIRTGAHMEVNAKIPSRSQQESIDTIFEVLRELRETEPTPYEIARCRRASAFYLAQALQSAQGIRQSLDYMQETGMHGFERLQLAKSMRAQNVHGVAQLTLPTRNTSGPGYIIQVFDPLLNL